MDKKYELTDETAVINLQTLYRIRALRDFGSVKQGDLGGFVAGEKNLSHDGLAWIADDAKVFGNAEVSDNARVYGKALVYDNARVHEKALVYGFASVYGDARIAGFARIFGNAQIFKREVVLGKVNQR